MSFEAGLIPINLCPLRSAKSSLEKCAFNKSEERHTLIIFKMVQVLEFKDREPTMGLDICALICINEKESSKHRENPFWLVCL